MGICKEDEINMFKRVSEKCEEGKITITKHLDSLKEKFGKLHKDKTSFFSESSNLLTNLSKKCSIDTTTLTKFMSTFDISVTELNNFREGIIADIKKDDIEKNKNQGIIQLKKEEITRAEASIKQINTEISVVVKSTKELIIKIQSSTTIEVVKTIMVQLQENETSLNQKNALLVSYIERLNKAQGQLRVLEGAIINAETLKIFRNTKYGQVKNISTNINKYQIDIRKFIDSKTVSEKTVVTKVKDYKKKDIAQNPLVSILKGEKDIINNKINSYKEINMTLEKKNIELTKQLTIIRDKSDNSSDDSLMNGGLTKLMQNTDLVLNNCAQIKSFIVKVDALCKNQDKSTLTTKTIITKRKVINKKPVVIPTPAPVVVTPIVKPAPVVVTPIVKPTPAVVTPIVKPAKGLVDPVKPTPPVLTVVDSSKPLDIESQDQLS